MFSGSWDRYLPLGRKELNGYGNVASGEGEKGLVKNDAFWVRLWNNYFVCDAKAPGRFE